jgi:POT family proton-dependent oligopeptide transporter
MTHRLGFSKVEANTITGFFIAFNYGLHLLGGYFSGRFISNRMLFSLGMFLLVIACLVLSIPTKTALYIGLSIFLTGAGLNVTCLNCMVTQRFDSDDKHRESAFFFLYSGMNIGFFAGFTISGIFEKVGNYQLLFLIGAIGNIIAFLLVMKNWRKLQDISTPLSRLDSVLQRKKTRLGVMMVLSMVPVMYVMINFATIANGFVLLIGAMVLVILSTLAFQQQTEAQKKKMLAYIALMLASFVFWTLYQIAPMGLTLFIKHNVARKVMGFEISPQWMQNVNTIVIVFGGPLMSILLSRLREKGMKVNIPMQFVVALILIGIAFVILPLGIMNANASGLSNINWIVASYVLQSVGELLLSPVGYAMVGQLAPSHLQGVMMGAWMMVTGVAATLSNHFSNMMVGSTQSDSALLTNDSYSQVFSMLGWSAIIAAIVLFTLVPTLKRLIEADDKDDDLGEILDPEVA